MRPPQKPIVYVGGFYFSNHDMLTSVVGSMKTDEVLKEALDYSSDTAGMSSTERPQCLGRIWVCFRNLSAKA